MPPPRRLRHLPLGILILLALLAPAVAQGSIKIAGNAAHAKLRVNSRGWATVAYAQHGRWKKARISPQGRVTFGKAARGRDISAPSLLMSVPMAVTVRQTPNGRFWALQSWRRLKSGPIELRLSRWSGAPTSLALWAWCCKWRSEVARGRATFHGKAIYGYHSTPSGAPTDKFGRNVYIDTFRGGRWVRTMGILTHRPTGKFGLWIRPHWRGKAYRARIVGPNWGRMLGPDAEGWTASLLGLL
jgi:hypothetical protein